MKKIYSISIIVILVALVAAVPVLAIPGKGAIKGEVSAAESGDKTVTLETKRGKFVVVNVSRDFDFDTITIGDWVLVKGTTGEDGTIDAEWIKQIGKGSDKGDDKDKAEGKKDNSAFCSGKKQDQLHPLAEIGERFGVGEEAVMGYFCDGYGMGAIMLALKTSQLEGSDPGDYLEDRAEGKGWGQIWKEKGLIGSEKEGHSPPGHLKRPDHAGPEDNDE